MNKLRVLIGGPVSQRAAVLSEFLLSLAELEKNTVVVDYYFVDDNGESEASQLLRQFAEEGKNVRITSGKKIATEYNRNEFTHWWKEELIWHVARMKDEIIQYAIAQNYDYLFLIDSDLVLHPLTLEQLLAAKKDIISNIFWTKWQPNTIEMPQVWVSDEYTLYPKRRDEQLTDAEKNERMHMFLQQLRLPGIYEVGGLGACTLISRQALTAGVRFAEIPNLSYWGEDRHFCIRAQALGLKLYVDTHYPAYHIYRESELPGVAAFKEQNRLPSREEPCSISLCMIVKNEEIALPRCLDSVKDLVEEIIIVDTGSTDRTKEIAVEYGANIYDYIWHDDFAAARNFSFSKATCEYILWLDADDVLEARDRLLFRRLKQTLDPAVDSVTMEYHLGFDAEGNLTNRLRRNRLVRRDKQFLWIGAVHEYLAVHGHVFHSDIAVTHKKDKQFTDRNLQIYRKREADGLPFTPRDCYYFANELREHQLFEEAVNYYELFLATDAGWIEDKISACLSLAECYAHLCEREQRMLALLRSLEYDLPRAEVCCRLGALFVEMEDWQTAIYWYQLATRLERPKDNMGRVEEAAWTWLPHLQLCVCYDRLGQVDLAYKHNELAASYHPNHPSILYNRKYFSERKSEQHPGDK